MLPFGDGFVGIIEFLREFALREAARFPKNPNCWDFWVSFRLDGEDLFVDRLLMVRRWREWNKKKGDGK